MQALRSSPGRYLTNLTDFNVQVSSPPAVLTFLLLQAFLPLAFLSAVNKWSQVSFLITSVHIFGDLPTGLGFKKPFLYAMCTIDVFFFLHSSVLYLVQSCKAKDGT